MTTYEMSPRKFIDQYIYGKKQRVSRNMAYGSLMAQSLEDEEFSGDPLLDIMITKVPKLDIHDKPIQCENGIEVMFSQRGKNELVKVPFLLDGKEKIPLLAVPDTAAKGYVAFKEDKTSVRKWTQKMADESGQITFYVTAIYLGYGFICEDIELINVPVEYQEDGSLSPTGEIIRYRTKRDMVDIIKMTKRIKKAWKGIGELAQAELL